MLKKYRYKMLEWPRATKVMLANGQWYYHSLVNTPGSIMAFPTAAVAMLVYTRFDENIISQWCTSALVPDESDLITRDDWTKYY